MKQLAVFVDGTNKGEVFKKNGRWQWRRGEVAVEPFARGFVDGTNKGEVFKKNGRWQWRRGEVAVEPFARGSDLDDVAEWARKCCNGKSAEVRDNG